MKLWKTEEFQTRILFFVAVGVLIVVLVPLFWIAHYNFRSVDDFSFSRDPEAVWEESHSVVSVLVAQISNTKDIYFSWLGTFFSIWFSTSILGIFGKSAYYIGTYLSLGGSLVLYTGVLGRSDADQLQCIYVPEDWTGATVLLGKSGKTGCFGE